MLFLYIKPWRTKWGGASLTNVSSSKFEWPLRNKLIFKEGGGSWRPPPYLGAPLALSLGHCCL